MQNENALRSLDRILEDGLWPMYGANPADPEDSNRLLALAEVLQRMSEEDYQKLCQESDHFEIYIPDFLQGAEVRPFTWNVEEEGLAPYAKVLFLSPMLEQRSFDIVVAIVAHELAHLALKHKLFTKTPEEYDRQEEDAWERVVRWGFEKQWKKWSAVTKRRETDPLL